MKIIKSIKCNSGWFPEWLIKDENKKVEILEKEGYTITRDDALFLYKISKGETSVEVGRNWFNDVTIEKIIERYEK
jgi:hypothetical protein